MKKIILSLTILFSVSNIFAQDWYFIKGQVFAEENWWMPKEESTQYLISPDLIENIRLELSINEKQLNSSEILIRLDVKKNYLDRSEKRRLLQDIYDYRNSLDYDPNAHYGQEEQALIAKISLINQRIKILEGRE